MAIMAAYTQAMMDVNMMGNRSYDMDTLSTYFDSDSNNFTPMINSVGLICVEEAAEFMSAVLFPADGSWLPLRHSKNASTNDKNLYKKIKKKFLEKLADANFYPAIHKMMRTGLIYNTGMITTTYANGLDFSVADPRYFYSTKGAHGMRCFFNAEVSMTALELKMAYDYDVEADLEEHQEVVDEYKIIECILPNLEPYIVDGPPKEYKFCKVVLLKSQGDGNEDDAEGVTLVNGKKPEGYKTCPHLEFSMTGHDSMATRALSAAIQVEKFERDLNKHTDKVLDPPMALDKKTITNGLFSFDAQGLIALDNTDVVPQPVQTTMDLPVNDERIIFREQKVKEVFRIEAIRALKQTGLSQYEYNQVMADMLKYVYNQAVNISERVTRAIIERAHILLKENDPEYAKLVKEAKFGAETSSKFGYGHLLDKIKKAEKAANIGRFMQGAAPYLQVDNGSSIVLDVENTLRALADALDVSSIIKDASQVEEEKKQAVQGGQEQLMQNTGAEMMKTMSGKLGEEEQT